MRNEWKELKIDNLPSDILTGDYEVQFLGTFSTWTNYSVNGIYEIIEELENGIAKGIRYRKPEPLPPTHSDIMTKFWQMPVGCQWWKVESYQHGLGGSRYWIGAQWQTKQWFTNRESEVIPPEIL